MVCPNCKIVVNENVQNCPNCGHKLKKKTNKIGIVIIGVLIVVLGITTYLVLDNKEEKEKPKEPSENQTNLDFDYDDLVNKGPIYDENSPFLMPIEDIFTITGKGTIVTGRIAKGTIHVNDKIQIIGLNRKTIIQLLLVWKHSGKILKAQK